MMQNSRKRQTGQCFVELATGLIAIIPVILFSMDLYVLYMGASLNDTVCGAAARAASSGAPDAVNPGEPLRRAQGVAFKANHLAGAVEMHPQNVTVAENIVSLPPGIYGGPVDGQITVTSSVKVYPPFLLSIMSGPQGLTFTTSKTMPYTWSMQSTPQKQ